MRERTDTKDTPNRAAKEALMSFTLEGSAAAGALWRPLRRRIRHGEVPTPGALAHLATANAELVGCGGLLSLVGVPRVRFARRGRTAPLPSLRRRVQFRRESYLLMRLGLRQRSHELRDGRHLSLPAPLLRDEDTAPA